MGKPRSFRVREPVEGMVPAGLTDMGVGIRIENRRPGLPVRWPRHALAAADTGIYESAHGHGASPLPGQTDAVGVKAVQFVYDFRPYVQAQLACRLYSTTAGLWLFHFPASRRTKGICRPRLFAG